MANTFKNYESAAVTTETTVLTGPASTQTIVIGLSIANTTGSEITADVKLNSTFISKTVTIPTGTAFIPIGGDQKVVVEASDTIKVTATGATDVVVSVLEIT